MALDIDTTRGDLWVASAEAGGGVATLHKLQLISGRVLTSFDVPADLAPVRPVDLSVTASGAVLVLDAETRRVLILRPRTPALQVLAALAVDQPASLTAGADDGVVYVAHRDGISRVELRNGAVAPLAVPAGTRLDGIERLRRHGAELIGVQARPDGSRRVVRLALDAAGRAVTGVRAVDVPLPEGATTLAAVSGDTVAFLVGEAAGPSGQRYTEWTFRRIRLAP
jgi:streptogramin lyase